MKTSEKGIDLLKVLEEGKGFSSKSYICSAGKRTIGYGHVILPDDNIIEPITEDQAEDILEKDVMLAENAINKYVKIPLTQNQFDALVCFVFNVGRTNFKTSTLLKFINEQLWDKIPKQFMRWVYHDKKLIKGLENRRKIEVRLWKNENIT